MDKKLQSIIVPIRSLGPGHRERIAQHLLELDEQDRYLRFGYRATDEQIRRYTDGLNFERDDIYGIYNRKLHLLAVAHVAFSDNPAHARHAEFGVSVLKSARGRGYGKRLFERAVMHARNEGVSLMYVHALTENVAMLKIAKNAGATVERDGTESEAHLKLPSATLATRLTEMIDDNVAEVDYGIKRQAKNIQNLWADWQRH